MKAYLSLIPLHWWYKIVGSENFDAVGSDITMERERIGRMI